MPYLPHYISAEKKHRLESEDPDLLKEMERENERYLDTVFPKPTESEVWEDHYAMETEWQQWKDYVRQHRESRYLQKPLPKNIERLFKNSERVYSRLIHNEIMRVVAMLTRNPPQVKVPQAGPYEKDRERADIQTRWLDQLLPFAERSIGRALWRKVVDHQAGDGLGGFFIYLTDAYDNIDFDEQPGEENNPQRYNARIDAEMQKAGSPFGIRWIDPMAVQFRMGEKGVYRVSIKEEKPRHAVYESLLKRKGQDEFDKLALPRKGDPGRPDYSHDSKHTTAVSDEAECIMVYDQRWYTYFVDGRCVDGPIEHGMPGVPFIPIEGMTTGSANYAEEYQGITWGLTQAQDALDAVLSQELDVALTYGRPHPIIQTPEKANVLMRDNKPEVLDLSEPGVRQLLPGQIITDALKDFKPKDTAHIQEMLLMIFQRSGLNPIAQGESPGADPAGYTVNTLQGAAQSNYEVLLDNLARGWGHACDFVRLMIRDTIQEKVWLSSPMSDGQKGGTQWQALGPKDIDETPAVVYIDPLSDSNRMAQAQLYMQANKEGYIPRRVAQENLPGYESDEDWDNEIVLDSAEKQMFELIMQSAMERIRMGLEAERQTPMEGPEGATPSSPGEAELPPDMQGQGPSRAPTTGADQAAASQNGFGEGRSGPAIMNSRRMSAGQGGRYSPPAGQMTDFEGGSQ